MSHVFISYSKKNRDYARELADHLLSLGFDVWIDDRIDYGSDWWRTIVRAIRTARAFIVIMTIESDASEWVQREVTIADKQQIPPFPLWLSGDFHASENWAIYVRTQYADVTNGNLPLDDFYERLAKVVLPKPVVGINVTPFVAEPPSIITDPELIREIDNPPPPDTSTLPVTRSILVEQPIPDSLGSLTEDTVSVPNTSSVSAEPSIPITSAQTSESSETARDREPRESYNSSTAPKLPQENRLHSELERKLTQRRLIIGGGISLVVLLIAFLLLNRQLPTVTDISTPTQQIVSVPTDASIPIKIVTATPQHSNIVLPTGISTTQMNSDGTKLPENCIFYTLMEGDTPFGVAEQYGADPFKLMEVNNLNDKTAATLEIGDVIIVPLEGCPLTAPIATLTPTAPANIALTDALTLRPTLTLPSTAINAKVEIAEVIGAGQLSAEGITIRNTGNNVNLKDWTIETSSGNIYTFSERILFSKGLVTVYSRTGQDTAIALFWNLTKPAYQKGDVVLLKDKNGNVQGSYRLPSQ